jgi:radical SAM protein with 4Fe4S-binding SPASM domain
VIQPELVTGCSMKYGKGSGGLCHFCGLQGIRSGPGEYQYMAMDTARRIADQVAEFCPKARIEFAMRGEPLMHPKAVAIIKIFRDRLPGTSLMLTTNGDTLRGHMRERLQPIFDAGLNLLLLDTYYPKERRDALREEAFALRELGTVEGSEKFFVVDFYEDWAGTGVSPYANHSKSRNLVVLMDDLAERDGEHSSRRVKSHAGSNPTTTIDSSFPLKRNCGRPFRELVFHADGRVPLCCDDWKQEYVVGDINTNSIEEIWTHPRFEAARARLFQKDRAFGPCAECDAPMAPRTGLLPVYDSPTEDQLKLTEETFKYKLPLWRNNG